MTLRLLAATPAEADDGRSGRRRTSRPVLTVCRGGAASEQNCASGSDRRAAGGGAAPLERVSASTAGTTAAVTVLPRSLAPALRLVGGEPEAEGGLASLEEFLRRASTVLEAAPAPVLPIRPAAHGPHVDGPPLPAVECRRPRRARRGPTGGLPRAQRPAGAHVRLAAVP